MNIDIKQVLSAIKNSGKRLSESLRSVYSLPHSGRYIALAVILVIVFTFITFPYEQLVIQKIHENEGKAYSSATFTGLNVGIVFKTRFDSFELGFLDLTSLSCKKGAFDLSTNPYTIFVKNRIKTDINIESVSYSGKDKDFSGTLTGDIDLFLNDKTGTPENGFINLKVTKGILQLGTINIPTSMGNFPLPLDAISIQSIEFESDIINKTLKIKKCSFDGDILACSLSGVINLEPVLKNSKLELKLVIDTSSKVLDKQRELINAFLKNKPFELNITGTLSRPDIKLNKPDNVKNEN